MRDFDPAFFSNTEMESGDVQHSVGGKVELTPTDSYVGGSDNLV